MPDPELSVVVPTFNRAPLLERTLASLAAQEGLRSAVEVVVVDDGSTDGTAEVAARYPGVVLLRQDNAGPAAARNRGWSAARGRVIAFTDDDTVPDPRWLADMADAFAADPSLDAAGGTVRPLRLSSLTRFVQAEQHASHGVGADGRIKYLVTANCAYRRDVLAALGGFDETFSAASGEDTDLTVRAQAAGYRMRLLDTAVVLHDHPDRLRPILRTYLKHGRSRRLVVDSNPSSRWGRGRREVLTLGHWRRRYSSYRSVGLRPVTSLAAMGLRVMGLLMYAAGIARSRGSSGPRPAGAPVKVVIACPGADHVSRGYERVARELATVLRGDPQLAVSVVKGSGRSPHETVLPSLRRDRPVARRMSRALSGVGAGGTEPRRLGGSWAQLMLRVARRQVSVTPYDLEAVTFGISLLCQTALRRPDVLVLQDVLTARVVSAGRGLPGWRTRILFVNGAPWPAPYPFADMVQHVSPATWDLDPAEKWEKVLLPLGTNVPDGATPDRAARLRQRFGLPEHGKVVVSVGTLLDHHKRHLHLIREMARLSEPRPFLVIAGSPDLDQRRIQKTAEELLGSRQKVVQVGQGETADLLACGDVFVLASLREGFGLVYIEALAAGLPTIAHGGALQRWLLGPFGTYVDMTRPGELATCLEAVLARDDRWSLAEARGGYVDGRFSWRGLGDDYVALVRRTSGGDR